MYKMKFIKKNNYDNIKLKNKFFMLFYDNGSKYTTLSDYEDL